MKRILALALATLFTASAIAQEDKLFWSNGDSLPGRLLGAEGPHLLWRSPFFVEPLKLDANYLETVTFARGAGDEKTKEPFRVAMRDGDVIFADLVSIDEQQIVLRSNRHGLVNARRDAVRSLRRMDSQSLIYHGPNGTAGWSALATGQAISNWAASPEGSLTTTKSRGELFRPIEIPGQAEIAVVLRSTKMPQFLMAFDDQPNKAVRIETWDDELVALSGDDFEPILTLEKTARTVELRLYWNHKSGELTVYSKTGKKLGTIVGADPSTNRFGVYLQNKGTDLSLIRLRVSRWNGQPPREVREGQTRVHLNDGNIVYGSINQFTAESGKLILNGPQQQEIDLDQVSSIHLTDDANSPFTELVQVMYFDGTLLTGEMTKIADGSIGLLTSHCEQPIVSKLAGARKLGFHPRDKAATDGHDMLDYAGGLSRGTLVGGDQPGSAVAWRPVGGLNASPLAPGCKGRFVRGQRADDGKPFDTSFFRDLLFLRSHDIVPCRVDSIDEQFVHLQSAFGDTARVPNTSVQAIEFGEEAAAEPAGFGHASWHLDASDDKSVELDGDRVTFRGPGSFGNRSILRGDEVLFHMKWDRRTQSFLTVRLFSSDADTAGSATDLGFYCSGDKLMIGAQSRGQIAFQQNANGRAELGRAQIKITTSDRRLQVTVNEQPVYSAAFDADRRSGNGVVFTTAMPGMMAGRATGEVTISNFEVRGSGRISAKRFVDDEAKAHALTVPRFRKQNPFTHILLAQNGDLLRGRLVSVNDGKLHFQSRLDDFSFPRDRISTIVWLHNEDLTEPADDGAPESPETTDNAAGPTVRVLLASGEIVVITPERMDEKHLVGHSTVLGRCAVPVTAIRELHVGEYGELDQDQGYADWKPRPAEEPKFASGPSGSGDTGQSGSPQAGKLAKDFELPMLEGEPFRLSEHSNRVVVLDFWATWCGPCVRAMPQYMQVLKDFDREQVLFIGINQAEPPATIRKFLKSREWKLRVALDANQTVAKQFGVEGIPHTVVIGPDGKVEWVHVGFRPGVEQELREAVQRLVSDVREADGAE